jgi:hypothetical protein
VGDVGQLQPATGGERHAPAHLPQRCAHQHLVQLIECHVLLGTGARESLHPIRPSPVQADHLGADRPADPGSAGRRCQTVVRFGSFHPGRGKWQV